MKLLILTVLFGAVSSVIPVFNMEIYLAGVYAKFHHDSALLLAIVGSFGQNVGKLVWFYVARGALDIPWLKAKLEDPKRKQTIEKWQSQIGGRPMVSGVLTFVSAAVGFPPFFAIAAVAGSLRMNVVVFFVAGLVGRVLFFWALLAGVGLVWH